MTDATEYRTFLSVFIDNNEPLFVVVLLSPFFLRALVNNYIINVRDNSKYFLLMLSPFSQDAGQFAIECMLRFYWKPVAPTPIAKRISNFLSLLFVVMLATLAINEVVERK
jgi:hypothetical protein